MYLNNYPNYHTNSFYPNMTGGLRRVNLNGRESIITVSSPFNFNYVYNHNYNRNLANIQMVPSNVIDLFYNHNLMQKSSTPIKLDPQRLLLKPPASKSPPKSKLRTSNTPSTSFINAKYSKLLKQKTSIDKSTSTTNLNGTKLKTINIDKFTQTHINKIKLIALKKERRPPIPPTIIGNSAKREEKKQKIFKKFASTSSSPMSRPMSNVSEKSVISSVSTASTSITKLKFLGVTRCDPNEYKSKYQSSLISSKNIPGMLSQIINTSLISSNHFHRLSNQLKSPFCKSANVN